MYTLTEEWRQIAEEVIEEQDTLRWIKECGVKIGFLKAKKTKTQNGKRVYADCSKVSAKSKAFMGLDFIITVYGLDEESLTERQRKILMHHELLHIGATEKDGKLKYKIAPHDLEDFREIVNTYGTDWMNEG